MSTKKNHMSRSKSKELELIPGVGVKIAQTLREIGIHDAGDLKGKNPEKLYQKLCRYKANPVDRFLLYVIRCAVYYASNERHDPKLLKWWNWKNKN